MADGGCMWEWRGQGKGRQVEILNIQVQTKSLPPDSHPRGSAGGPGLRGRGGAPSQPAPLQLSLTWPQALSLVAHTGGWHFALWGGAGHAAQSLGDEGPALWLSGAVIPVWGPVPSLLHLVTQLTHIARLPVGVGHREGSAWEGEAGSRI